MDNDLIEKAKEYARSLLANNYGGHDYNHTLRVYNNAVAITKKEQGADLLIVSIAALLHDVDDYKLFNTENYQNARVFLESNDVPEEQVHQIIEAIDSVSFSKNKDKRPGSLEGMIVQDADRLDAIGAIGIARTFAFGGEHSRPMEATIKHFDEKLFLLKDLMNTETAKSIAKGRHAFMKNFINELNQEINEV